MLDNDSIYQRIMQKREKAKQSIQQNKDIVKQKTLQNPPQKQKKNNNPPSCGTCSRAAR